MAIDLSNKRQIVLFEIDRKDPHDLNRFHRNISQMIADKTIGVNDFEEVVGSYEGKMNVAYCMSYEAFVRGFGRIEYYMRGQTEVYAVDLDHLGESESWSFDGTDWRKKPMTWIEGWAIGHIYQGAPGWTYFPSSGQYFTLVGGSN